MLRGDTSLGIVLMAKLHQFGGAMLSPTKHAQELSPTMFMDIILSSLSEQSHSCKHVIPYTLWITVACREGDLSLF
jgi:hypothetical protein